MTYLTRHFDAHIPDIKTSIHRSRYSDQPVLKHLSAPFALAAFAAECLLRRVDVVHINIAPRGSTWRKMLYQAVALGLGKRTVLHLHGAGYDQYYAELPPTRQAVVRKFFARGTVAVALGGHWKRFMLSQLALPAGKVVEIANGVPAVDLDQRPPNAVPSIVFLGEVGHRKGVDTLIDALARLSATGLPWTAAIGGNGDLDAARAHARRVGVEDRVDFLGWVDETKVDELLRAADLLVLPSRAENQPVAILEAMARAVPVVATRIGGIPEQVLDGRSGLLVEPDDPGALAQALESLIRSPDLRLAFGKAGQQRFEELFSVASCAERFAQLYRSL
ncbi:MAG TPA: glycosyltransferase family 4 protein [Caulobacter sp.]|nr:glycosyltransferase family 4 protein [Caulobacter sp.]